MKNFDKLIYPELSYKITGILFAVHNELGRFRNEKQYCDAIENYLKQYEIPYKREEILLSSFRGEEKGRNKIDFLIMDKIILEIKAKPFVSNDDYRQVRRYLAAINRKLGILVNFRQRYIKPKRILNSLAKE